MAAVSCGAACRHRVGRVRVARNREGEDCTRDNRFQSARSVLLPLHTQPIGRPRLVGIAFALFKSLPKFRGVRGAALLVGVGVFSHWMLDLFVHTQDLPLYDDVFKVGLGLWNYPILAMMLEGGLLVGGILVYLGSTTAKSRFGRYGVAVFGLVMLVIQLSSLFGPPPPSPQALALVMLVCYFGFAGIAFWLEGKRPTGLDSHSATV